MAQVDHEQLPGNLVSLQTEISLNSKQLFVGHNSSSVLALNLKCLRLSCNMKITLLCYESGPRYGVE